MNYMNKMLAIVLALGFILSLIGLTGCNFFEQSPSVNLNQAIVHYNQGVSLNAQNRYDEAIAEYNKSIELNPKYVDSYNGRGYAYFGKKQYDLAITDHTTAIQMAPTSLIAYRSRGSAYYNTKQYDLAIADYTTAIILEPGYAKTYISRGEAYRSKGQSAQAIADFKKAIELSNDIDMTKYATERIQSLSQSSATTQVTTQVLAQASAYNQQGVALFNQGKNDEAIAEFSKAIQVYQNYPAAYTNRGIMYILKQDYNTSITDFNNAIKLNPGYAFAYSNRALAYISTQRYQEAVVDLNKSLKIEPLDDVAWNNMGVAYEELGKPDLAKSSYEAALKFNPDNMLAQDNKKAIQAGSRTLGHNPVNFVSRCPPRPVEAEVSETNPNGPDNNIPPGTSTGGTGITQSSLSLTGVWVSNYGQQNNEYGLLIRTEPLNSVEQSYYYVVLNLTETSTSTSIGGVQEIKPITFTGTITTTLLRSGVPVYQSQIGVPSTEPVSGTRSDLAVNLLWGGHNYRLGGSGNNLEGVTTLYQPAGAVNLVEVRPMSGSYKTYMIYFWLKRM